MGQQIEKLAQFVATTQWEDVPESVQRHVKLVLLDTLGVILAGAERPEVRQLRERLAATAGTGATVYARGWPVHDPRTAALLNGIGGRAIHEVTALSIDADRQAARITSELEVFVNSLQFRKAVYAYFRGPDGEGAKDHLEMLLEGDWRMLAEFTEMQKPPLSWRIMEERVCPSMSHTRARSGTYT